ncbi:MAG: T9SS type A sorting domain-containing protein [Fimbriimonadaceae bacterium]|nr:T9SS type A sorting domain-containing protein [Chitinophagales bacterium]
MKPILLFLLCAFSVSSFSQTGYFEWNDDPHYYVILEIEQSNDGHLIMLADEYLIKQTIEGNEIWRIELSTFPSENYAHKVFAIPGNGYYLFSRGDYFHISEDGELLSSLEYEFSDFGYDPDDFEHSFQLSDVIFTGSEFHAVSKQYIDIDDDTTAYHYFWIKFDMNGNILSHINCYVGTDGLQNSKILYTDSNDYIFYYDYFGEKVHKRDAVTGELIDEQASEGYNLTGVYQTSESIFSYGKNDLGTAVLNEYIIKRNNAGEIIWNKTYSIDMYLPGFDSTIELTHLTELESGNLTGLLQSDSNDDSSWVILQTLSPEGDTINIADHFALMDSYSSTNFPILEMQLINPNLVCFGGSKEAHAFLLITDTLANYYHVNLTGKLYHDSNSNGFYDMDETVFSSTLVKSEPLTYFGYTNEAGEYDMLLGKDTAYTITVNPVSGWDIVDPDPLSFTATEIMDGDTLSGNDFILDYTTSLNDVSVSEYQAAIIPGFETHNSVTIKNIGNQYDESGTVVLNYPSILLDPVAIPDYFSLSDTIITWNYTDLDPYETQTFDVSYFTDTLLYMIGESVLTIAEVTTDVTDIDLANNTYESYNEIVSSYDPNHKTVSPAGEGTEGNISDETNYLTYTIDFQNTGTAEAHFINIYDTLDSELDIETIEMLSASHNYELIITAPNILRWRFDSIFLPDSTTDLLGSMGYLKFRIKIKDAATVGDVIENTAGIYFDYNPVVLTNTTKNALANPDAIEDITADQLRFNIYPNPAIKYLTVDLKENTDEEIEIFITDIAGKIYLTTQIRAHINSATTDISKLTSGSYLITLKGTRNKNYGTAHFSVIR